MFVWRGNDPNFAHKKGQKTFNRQNLSMISKKLTKRKKGASVEDEILHGE